MSDRQPLIVSLKDTVRFFKERKTVGRMKTEHSIFIPSALMIEQAKETEEFIKAARSINLDESFKCPVIAEKVNMRGVSGIEFVFQFSPDTDFEAIIDYLNSRV